MRRYLSTLHTRSESHKKRFAFLASGLFTLLIFSLWALATFGTGGILAQNKQEPASESRQREVSPFASLSNGVAAGWAGFKDAFDGLKGGLEGVIDPGDRTQAEYEKLRNEVFNPVRNSR